MLGFTYRNVHTSAFRGLVVRTVNNPLLPMKRLTRVSVPGKDGGYVFEDGFENKQLEFQCVMAKGTVQERRLRLREVAAWLSGQGDLVLDHEPDKTYRVIRAVSDVGLTLDKITDSFNITFEAEPFQYGDLHTISANNPTALSLMNAGTAPADTMMTLTGTGNVMVSCGSRSFSLSGMSEPITLDSKRMLVYNASLENKLSMHTGGFIKLVPGTNSITVTGSVTNLTSIFFDTYL